jgi:hypothetical protein
MSQKEKVVMMLTLVAGLAFVAVWWYLKKKPQNSYSARPPSSGIQVTNYFGVPVEMSIVSGGMSTPLIDFRAGESRFLNQNEANVLRSPDPQVTVTSQTDDMVLARNSPLQEGLGFCVGEVYGMYDPPSGSGSTYASEVDPKPSVTLQNVMPVSITIDEVGIIPAMGSLVYHGGDSNMGVPLGTVFSNEEGYLKDFEYSQPWDVIVFGATVPLTTSSGSTGLSTFEQGESHNLFRGY